MSGLKALARHLHLLEDQLAACMRCGTCQAVCPLFAETGREADVARGKLALLDGLRQEMFKNPKGVHERLNRCLLCGACATNCPSRVNALEIFIKARAILTAYMGLPPAKKLLLRGMLSHPRFFDRLLEWGIALQDIFTRPADDLIGTSCARLVSPLLGDRHFAPLAAVPFHRRISALKLPAGESGLRVAFFVGCLVDKVFPAIAEAVITALGHHRVAVLVPPHKGCCGIPAISSGDSVTFNRLVAYNLKQFTPDAFDFLVTACATCTATIRNLWPLMLADIDRQKKAEIDAVAAKTVDINQFLVDIVGLEPRPSPEAQASVGVTYHDPCHLKKTLGVSRQPRALIAANPAYRLVEMPEADRCCGLGGGFSLNYYDLSLSIGRRKHDHIAATDSAVVATGCPACMIQIADLLSRFGPRRAIKHPVELYAQGLLERSFLGP